MSVQYIVIMPQDNLQCTVFSRSPRLNPLPIPSAGASQFRSPAASSTTLKSFSSMNPKATRDAWMGGSFSSFVWVKSQNVLSRMKTQRGRIGEAELATFNYRKEYVVLRYTWAGRRTCTSTSQINGFLHPSTKRSSLGVFEDVFHSSMAIRWLTCWSTSQYHSSCLPRYFLFTKIRMKSRMFTSSAAGTSAEVLLVLKRRSKRRRRMLLCDYGTVSALNALQSKVWVRISLVVFISIGYT